MRVKKNFRRRRRPFLIIAVGIRILHNCCLYKTLENNTLSMENEEQRQNGVTSVPNLESSIEY